MPIKIRTSLPTKLIDETALRSRQGNRDVYTFNLSCGDLDNKITPRTDPNIIDRANRRYDAAHAGKIQRYLAETGEYVLGAMLIAIDPQYISFEEYLNDEGEPSGVGQLVIYEEHKPHLQLFDGQHRRGAIANLIKQDLLGGMDERRAEIEQLRSEQAATTDSGSGNDIIQRKEEELEEHQKLIRRFRGESVAFILYAEGDVKNQRQMFSDAANAKPQEAITRARFDRRDAFNLAAEELKEETSELLRKHDLIDMERSGVGQTSPKLLSFNQLATTLKTLEFGYYGRVSRTRNAELLSDFSSVVETGRDFFDEFLPASVKEFSRLLADDLTAEDIPDERQCSFVFNATVLRVLAGCYQAWGKESWQGLADFLNAQRFEKNRQRGAILVQAGLVAPGANTPQARRQEVQGAIRYIVDAARKYHGD